MKLIRVGTPAKKNPEYSSEDGTRVDVSAFGEDFGDTFFGTDGPARLTQWLERKRSYPPLGLRNAWDRPAPAQQTHLHWAELQETRRGRRHGTAAEPVIFFKATSAIVGPDDNVVIPRNSEKTDWEVELAFVIGKTASYVEEANALDHVAGYLLHNDYSERAFQLERRPMGKGQELRHLRPARPLHRHQCEVPDPQTLDLWLKVNGEKLQDSNTADMAFPVRHLVHYLSQFMTLLPGDVISTGTPSGVGLGFNPPRYLQPETMLT